MNKHVLLNSVAKPKPSLKDTVYPSSAILLQTMARQQIAQFREAGVPEKDIQAMVRGGPVFYDGHRK